MTMSNKNKIWTAGPVRQEELEEIEYKAMAEARRRAQVLNESRYGFLQM